MWTSLRICRKHSWAFWLLRTWISPQLRPWLRPQLWTWLRPWLSPCQKQPWPSDLYGHDLDFNLDPDSDPDSDSDPDLSRNHDRSDSYGHDSEPNVISRGNGGTCLNNYKQTRLRDWLYLWIRTFTPYMAKTCTGSTASLQSPLYDGAPLSTEESLYSTYLYTINNKLSYQATAQLLNLMRVHFPSPTKLPHPEKSIWVEWPHQK